jgi:transposase InsO family protein
VCAEALQINRKNIYRQLKMPIKDVALKQIIQAVHREHPAYGHRRVALHLGINHKRAQRVMTHFHLRPPRRKTRQFTTRSTTENSYQNRIKALNPIAQAHQVWCSDLSRFVYRGTVWYLASIEDVATRQILAYKIGKRHDSHLVLATLQDALASGYRPTIFHSDQGNEFMAQRCTQYLEQHGIQISVSDVAAPWQNGHKESFFGRFKNEFGDPDRFECAGEFIAAIHHQIHYYNHKRIHTALKMPPAAFATQSFSDICLQKLGT